jgi:hypothetical protein
MPLRDAAEARMIARQGFLELRQRPFRRGMGRGVEVRIWRDPISMTTKT